MMGSFAQFCNTMINVILPHQKLTFKIKSTYWLRKCVLVHCYNYFQKPPKKGSDRYAHKDENIFKNCLLPTKMRTYSKMSPLILITIAINAALLR